jgi:hypothetical protein
MRPTQALDVHAALTAATKAPQMKNLIWWLTKNRSKDLGDIVATQVKAATTYHISSKVSDLVKTRAKALRLTAKFGTFEPPTKLGCLVFDEAIPVSSADGLIQHAHMLSWGPSRIFTEEAEEKHATLISVWFDNNRSTEDARAYVLGKLPQQDANKVIQKLGGFLPIGFIPLSRDDRIGSDPVASVLTLDAPKPTGDTNVNAAVTTAIRFTCAIWDLMGETLAAIVREGPEIKRDARRRARKVGLAPRVTVVQLRRREPAAETGMGTPLDHRVEVRGHWRNQPYGPRNSPEYKRIWIKDHVKGPKHAPLIVTEKVYTLSR